MPRPLPSGGGSLAWSRFPATAGGGLKGVEQAVLATTAFIMGLRLELTDVWKVLCDGRSPKGLREQPVYLVLKLRISRGGHAFRRENSVSVKSNNHGKHLSGRSGGACLAKRLTVDKESVPG